MPAPHTAWLGTETRNKGEMTTYTRVSERTVKCKFCSMRGASGTPQALYWYEIDPAPLGSEPKVILLHEATHVTHLSVCESQVGRRYRITRGITERINRGITEPEVRDGTYNDAAPGKSTTNRTSSSGDNEELSTALDLLKDALGKVNGSVDEETVRGIVNEVWDDKAAETLADLSDKVNQALSNVTFPIEVHNVTTGETKDIGLAHKVFPRALRWANRRANIYLPGPAGTGKSHLAKQVAEALSLEFSSIALTVTKPVSDIVGYRDANGVYHDTAFRRRYEQGGVFLVDEADNGNPNTLNVFNEAISNGAMEFPDRRIERHPDFILICAANTFGTGPDAQYVGRMQLDAAFLNRFVFVEVPVDEALERALVVATGADADTVDRVLRDIRSWRKNAESLRLKVAITPRNAVRLAQALMDEVEWTEAISETVRAGMTDQDWSRVNA